MQRRDLLLAGAAALVLHPRSDAIARSDAIPRSDANFKAPPKTLRVAFDFAETGFDPPRVSDNSSLVTNAHIFESPLTYDLMADPALLVPQTALVLPEVSADAKHFVFTLARGIFFADDPAFAGKPRELVAEDYVYSIKRYYDPQVVTEHLYHFENAKLLGLSELRQQSLKSKSAFNYDTPVAGLRALDRYRFEVRLAAPAPRLPFLFAQTSLTGAVAREVVETYGAELMAHPVGTGPFRLLQWRRASRIVLERNPRFREQRYSAHPPPENTELVALAARYQGQWLPLVDRIEIAIIDEAQPRWLAFLGDEIDLVDLPSEFTPLVMPNGKLAPFLVKRGVNARRDLTPSTGMTFFNFDDTMVGGYTAQQVALRRAIGLAYDNALENRYAYGNAYEPAHSMLAPHGYGFDATLRSELGSGNLPRAKALLDMFGFVDSNGDGWRERPDGTPLLLRRAFAPDQRSRRVAELWVKRMKAVGLRLQAEFAPFGELINKSLAGKLMMWGFSWANGSPDSDFFLGLAYGPNSDQSNDARFKLAAFDRLYEKQSTLANGPERLALMRQCQRLMLAYAPYVAHQHSVVVSLTQPRVQGYVRHPFASDRWRAVDVTI